MFKLLSIAGSLFTSNYVEQEPINNKIQFSEIESYDDPGSGRIMELINLLLSHKITVDQFMELIKLSGLSTEQIFEIFKKLITDNPNFQSQQPLPPTQSSWFNQNLMNFSNEELSKIYDESERLSALASDIKNEFIFDKTLDQNNINEFIKNHNILSSNLGNKNIQELINELRNIDHNSLNAQQAKNLLNNFGINENSPFAWQQFNQKLDNLNSFHQNINGIFENSGNLEGLSSEIIKNIRPEMLNNLSNSNLLNPDSIKHASEMAKSLNNPVSKAVANAAKKIDTITTVLMWTLSAILLIFGTVGLIMSSSTLRYKTLVTHKKLLKNPKFLLITWSFVILAGIGTALGAIYG